MRDAREEVRRGHTLGFRLPLRLCSFALSTNLRKTGKVNLGLFRLSLLVELTIALCDQVAHRDTGQHSRQTFQ